MRVILLPVLHRGQGASDVGENALLLLLRSLLPNYNPVVHMHQLNIRCLLLDFTQSVCVEMEILPS